MQACVYSFTIILSCGPVVDGDEVTRDSCPVYWENYRPTKKKKIKNQTCIIPPLNLSYLFILRGRRRDVAQTKELIQKKKKK